MASHYFACVISQWCVGDISRSPSPSSIGNLSHEPFAPVPCLLHDATMDSQVMADMKEALDNPLRIDVSGRGTGVIVVTVHGKHVEDSTMHLPAVF